MRLAIAMLAVVTFPNAVPAAPSRDVTRHAEIVAISRAQNVLGTQLVIALCELPFATGGRTFCSVLCSDRCVWVPFRYCHRR